MRVFLTGGTGLVGSHLAERLRARGDEVVALQRPGSDTAFLESVGCRIVRGDVEDSTESLAVAMEGSDAVVHGAALIYAGLPWDKIEAVNVAGTSRVLKAAAQAGARTAVHLSSVATYGGQLGRVDESTRIDTPVPASDFYARSKREAEAAAREVSRETALPVTMLRPSAIYGARDRLFAPILARLTRLPLIPLLGTGETSLPVVYAGNVAAAAEAAIDSPPAIMEGVPPVAVYNVGQDYPIGVRELLELFATGLGRRARFVRIPKGVVRTGAKLIERVGGALPGAGDLPVTRAAMLATEDNPYLTEAIRRELGWTPPHTHREGVAATTEWLRRQ